MNDNNDEIKKETHMMSLTNNNKDYLFRVSNFTKEVVLEEEIDYLTINKLVKDFTLTLIDDGVIDEAGRVIVTESLIMMLSVMLDNP